MSVVEEKKTNMNKWNAFSGLILTLLLFGMLSYIVDANNRNHYPLMNLYDETHDIAIAGVTLSRTVVGQGYSTNINVTVANQGDFTETFNVTAYANTTTILTQTVILENGNSTTMTFTWNTTGFVKGNYTVSAYATPVQGETDTEDNNRTDGWVLITKVGDLGGDLPPQFFKCDGLVNWRDLGLFVQAYRGLAPAEAMYLADLGGSLPPKFFVIDGVVNARDLALLILCYRGFGP